MLGQSLPVSILNNSENIRKHSSLLRYSVNGDEIFFMTLATDHQHCHQPAEPDWKEFRTCHH